MITRLLLEGTGSWTGLVMKSMSSQKVRPSTPSATSAVTRLSWSATRISMTRMTFSLALSSRSLLQTASASFGFRVRVPGLFVPYWIFRKKVDFLVTFFFSLISIYLIFFSFFFFLCGKECILYVKKRYGNCFDMCYRSWNREGDLLGPPVQDYWIIFSLMNFLIKRNYSFWFAFLLIKYVHMIIVF